MALFRLAVTKFFGSFWQHKPDLPVPNTSLDPGIPKIRDIPKNNPKEVTLRDLSQSRATAGN
jgi:hypothetical protein